MARNADSIEVSVGESSVHATIRTPRDEFELALMRQAIKAAIIGWRGTTLHGSQAAAESIGSIGSTKLDSDDDERVLASGWQPSTISVNYNHKPEEAKGESKGIFADPVVFDENLPNFIPAQFAFATISDSTPIILARIPANPLTGDREITYWNELGMPLSAPPLSPPAEAQGRLHKGFGVVGIPSGAPGGGITVWPNQAQGENYAVILIREKTREEDAANKYGLHPDEISFLQTSLDATAIIERWNATQKNRNNAFTIKVVPR